MSEVLELERTTVRERELQNEITSLRGELTIALDDVRFLMAMVKDLKAKKTPKTTTADNGKTIKEYRDINDYIVGQNNDLMAKNKALSVENEALKDKLAKLVSTLSGIVG